VTLYRAAPDGSIVEEGASTRAVSRRFYSSEAWRRAAAAQVRREPWCASCGATTDLTADHVTAIAAGGHPFGPLATLCRSCNGRKGAR
jgi:5-methylcytosine-specific restriction endonuclease McrA